MTPELYALTHDTSKCTARIKQLVELIDKLSYSTEIDHYVSVISESAKEIDTIIDTYYKSQQDEKQ